MKRSSLFRFFGISFIISFVIVYTSFYALRYFNESLSFEIRKHSIPIIVQIIESAPYAESIQNSHFNSHHRPPESPRHFDVKGPHEDQGGPHGPGTDLWVLSAQGNIIATNAPFHPPISWNLEKKPKLVHDFTLIYRPFLLISDLTLVRLDSKDEVYLLIGLKHHHPTMGPIWLQVSFLIFVIGLAVIIALILLSIYLKRKSMEARDVLARLEKGDLKARFEIKKLDTIGNLMLDFNRMASEIERLVHQIHLVEKARKNLLEELGHDLRTPLTSLRTSIEMLSEHLDEMPKEQQKTFLNVSRTELAYFIHLIEDLFFIADLGDLRYKNTTEIINLSEIVSDEVKFRISNEKQKITWTFEERDHFSPTQNTSIFGDHLLIRRLIKNSFDNASKFASSNIVIKIESIDSFIHLIIEDDGVGIDDHAIELFGQRKKQRIVLENYDSVSLGLGSVIMKTIIELHGGEFQIFRKSETTENRGTRLILKFPKNAKNSVQNSFTFLD